MLKEFLDELQKLNTARIKPEWLDAEKQVYLLAGQECRVPPPRIIHAVTRLSSLLAEALHCSGDIVVSVAANRVLARRREDGRDVVTLDLHNDSVWLALWSMATCPRAMGHRELVEFLEKTLLLPEETIAPFRSVTFGGTNAAASTAGKRIDRMGQDIRAAVAEDTPIPDLLTVATQIYVSPEETAQYTLEIPITVSAAQQNFTLRPDRRQMLDLERIHLETIYARCVKAIGDRGIVLFGASAPAGV